MVPPLQESDWVGSEGNSIFRTNPVRPVETGQALVEHGVLSAWRVWIPAFAGMTVGCGNKISQIAVWASVRAVASRYIVQRLHQDTGFLTMAVTDPQITVHVSRCSQCFRVLAGWF